MTAREEILTRVKEAIGPRPTQTTIPRDYRVATDHDLTTFLDRLAHYEAVTHVVEPAHLAETIRSTLQANRKIVVPAGIPEAWTTNLHPLTDDPPLTPDELDAADGVMTTCALAIAQTGTIVLDGGPGMGRRALTLIPDYHVCVVDQRQLVSSVPEAVRAIEDPTRPLTFISGPSATVDIEMVRVRGVHGPRRLEVIITTRPEADAAS